MSYGKEDFCQCDGSCFWCVLPVALFPVASVAFAILTALLLSSCTLAVEPARAICRGDSVNADWQDTALVRCGTLDSLARR